MDFIRLVKILSYTDHSISVTLMLTAGLAALEGNNSLTLNSSTFNHKEVAYCMTTFVSYKAVLKIPLQVV